MPKDVSAYINAAIVFLAVICTGALVFRIIYNLLKNRYAPITSEKAQIVDKYVVDNFSKIFGRLAKKPQYYVVFSVGNKKHSFRVSEFSYRGYKVKERGTLKYKGNRLIEFC